MNGEVGFALVFAVCMGAAFGLPLVAVGVILRLCESSWGKRPGDLGSTGILTWGGLLSLPFASWVEAALVRMYWK